MAAKEPPTAEFDAEIMSSGLVVKDWAINGNQGQTWQAETFTSLDAAPPALSGSSPSTAKKPEAVKT